MTQQLPSHCSPKTQPKLSVFISFPDLKVNSTQPMNQKPTAPKPMNQLIRHTPPLVAVMAVALVYTL